MEVVDHSEHAGSRNLEDRTRTVSSTAGCAPVKCAGRVEETAIRSDAIEQRVENLGRAREILSELLGTLDIDRGGDIALQLSMLYAFLLSELVDVGIRRDAVRLGRLIGIVNTLSTAFALAAKQLDEAGAAPLAASA